MGGWPGWEDGEFPKVEDGNRRATFNQAKFRPRRRHSMLQYSACVHPLHKDGWLSAAPLSVVPFLHFHLFLLPLTVCDWWMTVWRLVRGKEQQHEPHDECQATGISSDSWGYRISATTTMGHLKDPFSLISILFHPSSESFSFQLLKSKMNNKC